MHKYVLHPHIHESPFDLRARGNSVLEHRTTVVEERVRRFRLGTREQLILGEIYSGHMVPVRVIEKLYFPGHTSYRIKRMGLMRRRGLVDIETYAVRERGRSNPRIVGKLYRLTEFGIELYEKILGREPRQTRLRINQPSRDEVQHSWRLGELRMLAHEKNVPWLYGKEVREKHRLPHYTQVDAIAGGVCICHLDPRPGKYAVNHLRSSMGNMAASATRAAMFL